MHDYGGPGTPVAEFVIMNAATVGLLTLTLVDRYANNSRALTWFAKFNLQHSVWRYLSWPRKEPGAEVEDHKWTILVLLLFGAISVAVMDVVWIASLLLQ